jgi:LysM repeat protein
MMFKKNTAASHRPARRRIQRNVLRAKAASRPEEIEEYENESEPSMKLSQAFIVVLVLHVLAVAGIYGFNQLKEKPSQKTAAKVEATQAAPTTDKRADATPKTEPAATAKSKETQTTYSVVAGDTLRRIASKFNTSIEAIEKANNLTSTSVIKVGQVLNIGSSSKTASAVLPASEVPTKTAPSVVAKAPPVKAPEAQDKADVKPQEKSQGSADKTHVVAKGDNPYSLAKRYNITQVALMKANNIDDPKKLKIGQTLIIP